MRRGHFTSAKQGESRGLARWGVGAWVYPLVLLAFAACFFAGDLGWWKDDYYFNLRDPSTGDWSTLINTAREPWQPRLPHLNPWRYLHLTGTSALITLLWNHPAVCHVIGAVLHGVNALVLFLLIRDSLRAVRRCGRQMDDGDTADAPDPMEGVHAGAAGAMIHLIWVAHHEVVLWPSAFASGLSATAYLAMCHATLRYARRGGVGRGLLVPMLAVVIAGLNEQAGGGVLALPLLYLAARRAGNGIGEPGRTWLSRVTPVAWRALWPAAGAGLVLLAYAINLRVNGQRGLGVSAEKFNPPSEIHRHLAWVCETMWHQATMRYGLARGAWVLAWQELGTRPLAGAAWGAGLTVAGAWWWRCWTRTRPQARGDADSPGWGPWMLVLFGAAWFVCGCLPLAVIKGYGANPRTFYLSSDALCFAFAALLHLGGRRLTRSVAWHGAHGAAGALLVVTTMVGGLLYFGAAARFAKVTQRDRDHGRQLTELVPNPEPDTVFLPVDVLGHPVNTGDPRFDRLVAGAWEFSWSLPYLTKWAYRRRDVYTWFYKYEARGGFILDVTPESVVFWWRSDAPYGPESGPAPAPHAKIVPFIVDADGNIKLITHWRIRRGGEEAVVELPQTSRAWREGGAERFEWLLSY